VAWKGEVGEGSEKEVRVGMSELKEPAPPVAADNRLRIDILFKEYETLRAEIISQIGHMYTLLTVGAATVVGVVAWFVTDATARRYMWFLPIVLGVLGVVFWGLYRFAMHNVANAARHIQRLERRINALAGDDLLEWERRRAPFAEERDTPAPNAWQQIVQLFRGF
jgi:hypothetical protein